MCNPEKRLHWYDWDQNKEATWYDFWLSTTHINEDCIDVICAVIALEGGDVRTEVVRCKGKIWITLWNYIYYVQKSVCLFTYMGQWGETNKNKQTLTRDNEDVPILVSVVRPVSSCAIPNCESGSLVADQLEKRTLERLLEHSFGKGWNQKKGRKQGWGKPCP